MLAGGDFLNPLLLLLTSFFLLFHSSPARGQEQTPAEKKDIYAVVRDGQGEIQGLLRFDSETLTLRSADNREVAVPVKYIQSITLERVRDGIPGEIWQKPRYAVRVENSQEIYTLEKKYTFHLNTNVGLMTRTIDPQQVSVLFSNPDGKPFFPDKSFVFSLELKF
ncbi:MAG: hypothetical protein HY697_04900 [Deltaproteobacteria bacterium]|nr:hypothetical protein [Deltaproteobacteria bacterium]